MKTHKFTLEVKTEGSRKSAEEAVLFAFAQRKPDSCSFHLRGDMDTTMDFRIFGPTSTGDSHLWAAASLDEALKMTQLWASQILGAEFEIYLVEKKAVVRSKPFPVEVEIQ